MTASVRTRDSQRAKVYEAEHQLEAIMDRQHETSTIKIAGSTLTLPAEKKFADLASMQRYVDLALPGQAVKVRARRGVKAAHYHASEIAIPMEGNEKGYRWAMRELVLCHEIAHHLSYDQHGPEFTTAFVDLLDRHMGPEVALVMTILLHENGAR
jgi:putative metallohydrolase (TIGR04338 family)